MKNYIQNNQINIYREISQNYKNIRIQKTNKQTNHE